MSLRNRLLLSLSFLLVSASAFSAEEPKPAEGEKKEEEPTVKFAEDDLKYNEIEMVTAGPGNIDKAIEVVGEIVMNADTVAHLTPRAQGIVQKTLKGTGDTVAAGETLAVIDSAELGNEKIEYFTARLNLDNAKIDLDREQIVHDNTQKLLDALSAGMETAAIDKITNEAPIGDNKSKLLTTYAASRLAKASWVRAQKMKEESLISAAGFEQAAKDFESSQAEFKGAFEEVKFSYNTRFLTAQRTMRINETAFQNARRKLSILGLSEQQIDALANEKTDQIALYELKAPFAGTILEKHLTTGERVDESKDCYVIADLSTVQVNLRIPARQVVGLKPGLKVKLSPEGVDILKTAELISISPIVDGRTQSALGKAILQNKSGELRPGLFVNASIIISQTDVPVVVPNDAIQIIEGNPSVFALVSEEKKGEDLLYTFKPMPVKLGDRDANNVSIESGIEFKEDPATHKKLDLKVAGHNSFYLKAKMLKPGED
jgi:cobalt-zinc-cadmium efflux system membrane fusion protein